MALGTIPALTALGTAAHGAVSVGENISVFPDRDFVVAVGYLPGEQLRVEVLRNDVVIGTTQGPAAETPEGVGLEVNHGPLGTAQPGDCWSGFTPDIIGGDVVRVTALDRPGQPTDTMTVKDLAFTGTPVLNADGTVSVTGTATPGLSFAVEFRRDKPAPRFRRGPFVPTFEAGTNQWKATFRPSTTTSAEGLTPDQQRQIALNEASWLAVSDQISETTLAELGEPGGVAAGCTGSADPNTLVGGLEPINIAGLSNTAASPDWTFSGTARAGVAAVTVTVGTLGDRPATLTADPNGGPSTWTLAVPKADLAGLPDGTVAVTPRFDATVGATKNVLKDTAAPLAPSPSVPPGTYGTTQAVALNKPAGEESSKVYWEIGNTTVPDPTAASNLYTSQISVTSNQTIKGRLIDAAGNPGAVGTFAYRIGNPPPAPTGLVASESTTAAGAANLRWTAAAGAAGYNVYRGGLKVNAATVTSLSFTDTSAGLGVHGYTVRALDVNGIESLDSTGATVTIEAPPVPSGLRATAGDSRVTLSWTAVTGATRYRIFRDNVALPTLAGSATFTDTGLVNGSLYAYEITALDAGGNQSAHTGAVQATPVAGDTVAPTVTTRVPASAATGVNAANNITATFSEPVQGVSGTTFTLRTGTTTGTGTAVTAAVTYDAATRTATLNPGANLAANTTYTATLTSGIRDTATTPNALVTTRWQFTTATGTDTIAPSVTTRVPASAATGVNRSNNITATFSENVQAVSGSTLTLRTGTTTGTGTAVTATVSYDAATRTATLNPSSDLAASTTYTATLTGGATAIRDSANNALVTTRWQFTTGTATTVTNPPPTLTNRAPSPNSTGFDRDFNITINFSEAVTGVSTTTFTVRPVSASNVVGAPVAAVVSYNATTRGAGLNPNAPLAANAKYRVTVTSGIRDTAGAAFVTTSWDFTTGAS